MPDLLTIDGLEVRYGSVRAVAGASLALREGELLALLGPSGCGKTSLLRAVAGFERAYQGEIRLDARLIESPATSVAAHQRSVGLVFQEYALFPHRTVAANIAFGLGRASGRRQRVRELLALAGIEGLEGRYPHQLSGGQQQRVAVLRSIAPHPRLLLLDEPFSNLDAALRIELRAQVAQLLRAEGVSAILVTHDRADAMAIADRVAVMEAGTILQVAPPRDLYFAPGSEAVARYGGELQFVPGQWREGHFLTPLGLLRPALGSAPGGRRALVRPEWLLPCQGGGTPALITAARLEGQLSRYTISLESGYELAMTCASGLPLHENQSITVRVQVPVPVFE